MTLARDAVSNNVAGARDLRTRLTPAEARLWSALRNRGLDGLKFRRQHPIGPFVADFCCPDRRLIVEVDGEVHDDDAQAERDAERTSLLEAAGYRVVRVRNAAVLNALPAVLDQIRGNANACAPVPPIERSRTRGW